MGPLWPSPCSAGEGGRHLGVVPGEKLPFTSHRGPGRLPPWPAVTGSQWSHLPLTQTSKSALVLSTEIRIYPASSSRLGAQVGLHSKVSQFTRVPTNLIT